MVEDRLVGIKSREVYEAPGAIALIAAHAGAGERHRRARPGPVQAAGRAALGRAGLRRPVVLAAQAGARRVHRRGQRARVRRRPDDAARRPRDRHRPAQRAVALRLQPRHLRRGRHLRPVAGQGLRRALGPALEDRGQARPRPGQPVADEPDRGSGAGGSPSGPAEALAALSRVGALRLAARAVRPRGLARPRPGAAPRRPARRRRAGGDARRASTRSRSRSRDGRVRARRSPTRTCTRRSSAG